MFIIIFLLILLTCAPNLRANSLKKKILLGDKSFFGFRAFELSEAEPPGGTSERPSPFHPQKASTVIISGQYSKQYHVHFVEQ